MKLNKPILKINGETVRTYSNVKGIENSNIWFDAGSDKAHGTLNGATVIETGQTGYNYDVAISQALKDDAGVYPYLNNKQLSFSNDNIINNFGTNSFRIEVDAYLFTTTDQVFAHTEFDGTGIGWRFRGSRVLISDGSSFVECNFSGSNLNSLKTFGLIVDRDNQLLKTSINGVETGVTADISSIGAITDNSKPCVFGRAGSVNSNAFVKEIRAYDGNNNLVSTFNSTNYSSGTLTTGTHLQQFPETGIPQTVNEEWNRYIWFDGVDNNVGLSDTIDQILTTSNSWRIEFKNIYIGDGVLALFGIRQDANNRFVIYINTSIPIIYCDFFVGGVYISASSNAISPNTFISSLVITYDGSRTASGIAFNIDGNTTRANTGGSGTISDTTLSWTNLPKIGSRGNNSTYFEGFIPELNIYDAISGGNLIHSFKDLNEYNDTESAITATINGSPTKQSLPEDLSNLGFDIFGNAIQQPISTGTTASTNQIGWNIRNNSYLEPQQSWSKSKSTYLIVIEDDNLSGQTNSILFDGRDAADDGMLLWINGSGYLEFRYNTQSVVYNEKLTNERQIIGARVDGSNINLYKNNNVIVSSGQTDLNPIDTTTNFVIATESFGSKSSYFDGIMFEHLYYGGALDDVRLVNKINQLKTKYNIS